MNRGKWYFTLIAVLLVATIGLAAGCGGPTAPAKPTEKPTINSFTASPPTINAGERTTLSWNVSGATTVNIQPEIGNVSPSGSLDLAPEANVTYTLTATNEAGSSTVSVGVTVTPIAVGTPDLVVTDVWLSGSAINYTMKNLGDAESTATKTYFYINDAKVTDDYVEPLAPGEEKTTFFPNYGWTFQLEINPFTGEMYSYDVKVCVDAENALAETNEGNNCITEVWGLPFSYYFFKFAHTAEWRSGAGELRWPGYPSHPTGAAWGRTFAPIIVMMPEQVNNGWVLGRFSQFYQERGTEQIITRGIEVPINTKFTAQLRMAPDAKSTDGVRVALGYTDVMGNIVFFPKMDVFSDGQLRTYEVDLSPLEGKSTDFILWVEAKDSPEGDIVEWMDPKLVQEPGTP